MAILSSITRGQDPNRYMEMAKADKFTEMTRITLRGEQ